MLYFMCSSGQGEEEHYHLESHLTPLNGLQIREGNQYFRVIVSGYEDRNSGGSTLFGPRSSSNITQIWSDLNIMSMALELDFEGASSAKNLRGHWLHKKCSNRRPVIISTRGP